jgi:hypothetical protein
MKNLKAVSNPISHIGPVTLSVVVAVFIVAMGAQMIGTMQSDSICDGTWGFYINSTSTNPITETNEGCCLGTGTNGSGGDDPANCTTWDTDSALNQTWAGLQGLGMFGDWWTIIILAVIIGIVVGVLFQYLGGTLTGKGY